MSYQGRLKTFIPRYLEMKGRTWSQIVSYAANELRYMTTN